MSRGIPWSKCVELKTTWISSQNPAAGAIAVESVALNGAYDPLLAVGAQQPLYFDQWSAMYRKYCVISWKVKFDIVTTDNTNAVTFGFCPMTSSSALTNQQHYKEVAGCRTVVCTPDIDKNYMVAKGGVEKYLLGSKIRGRMMTDDNLYADCSANPTRPLYGHVFTQAFDGSADPATVAYQGTLYQTIVFFDPVVPALSSV